MIGYSNWTLSLYITYTNCLYSLNASILNGPNKVCTKKVGIKYDAFLCFDADSVDWILP